MKKVINFFNIILIPLSIIIGLCTTFKFTFLSVALYATIMFCNIIISSIASAVINKSYEDEYSAFWRIAYIILSSLMWSCYICF